MELLPFFFLYVKILLILTFSLSHHATSRTFTNFTDVESLLSFKAQVNDPYGMLATNWTTNMSFCTWVGVSCSHQHQRVTSIKLRDFRLQGAISSHLGNLSFLSELDLANCSLRGSIPRSLAQLPRLKRLILQHNFLSGPIPISIFNMSSLVLLSLIYNNLTGTLPSNKSFIMLPRLEFLSLASNQLTGEIPSAFGESRSLETFALSYNEFAGAIPAEFGRLPNLSVLLLGDNHLSGKIPKFLGNLTKLTTLELSLNKFEGEVPKELGNLVNLEQIYLASNQLSGEIPSIFEQCKALQILSLSLNQLTGKIPSSFAQCKDLQVLSLSFNNLTGAIPDELGSLSELRLMYLANNTLTGSIPSSFGNLTNAVRIDLAFNNIEGVIPKELGYLPNLEYLNLGPNRLTGTIPNSLLNASTLAFLQVTSNYLTGHIPVTIGRSLPFLTRLFINDNQFTGGLDFITSLSSCKDLVFLDVSQNEFDGVLPNSVGNLSVDLYYFSASQNNIGGEIPTTLGNLSSLLLIDLSINKLVGTIPLDIAKLGKLQVLHLGSNKISGMIPSKVSSMKDLGTLYLQNNNLIGPIPGSISNISQLQRLSLSSNQLSSTIPMSLWNLRNIIELNLSNNALYGQLSPQLGSLKALDVLDLSVNKLSGEISNALGQLVMITHIDLSSNSFQGEIPQSLGSLVNVKYLNLSHNFLSGSISKSIGNLPQIGNLDLSFNNLEGQIPEGRAFSNSSIPSLEGNVELCGAPQLDFPPCVTTNVYPNSRRKLDLLRYVLPIVAFIMVVLATLVLVFYRKRNVTNTNHSDFPGLNDHRLISYHELVRATDNFNKVNLIGKGSFGSVYRGCLDDGLIVAVKVLNLEVEGASNSFESEYQALCVVRHRNLIKIISICSSPDFKALVLQFMPKGNLDQLLYSDTRHLSLLQILNIMVDVSLALEYLHHHHPHTVLHCDLKPSNVLLDEEMTAHVSDFGIAKLLLGSMSVVSASTPGTIGYIAPEYGSTGTVSKMGDVYSFGILLLEMITRKKPTDTIFGGESSFREWICKAYPSSLVDIVDDSLLEDGFNVEQGVQDLSSIYQCLSSVTELGLICSSSLPTKRIPMTLVVPRLQQIRKEYMSQLSFLQTSTTLACEA